MVVVAVVSVRVSAAVVERSRVADVRLSQVPAVDLVTVETERNDGRMPIDLIAVILAAVEALARNMVKRVSMVVHVEAYRRGIGRMEEAENEGLCG